MNYSREHNQKTLLIVSKKLLLLILCSAFYILNCYAQAPSIEWQKSLGGTKSDAGGAIQQTSDGGYIVVGSSKSNDGDVYGHHGSTDTTDYWVVKLDNDGTIQWQKSLGGTGVETATSIQQTTDGGYIIGGSSNSNNGDITGHHGNANCTLSCYDYWVVKLNSAGAIQWQKSLGGTDWEQLGFIQQTNDGGYIIAGSSESNDGDVSGHHGIFAHDYWVVKLDTVGGITWQKSLGGTGSDMALSIQQTSDGGYIVAGASASTDGDVTGNHGGTDCWIVKLNSEGTIVWQKSLGGTNFDYALSIQQTNEGGYIVSGYGLSNDGDVSGHHGTTSYYDYWVVKLDNAGTIQWEKSLGGTKADLGYSIQQISDGGYIIAGYAKSNDGDITGHIGSTDSSDCWIVKLDNGGNIQWQKSLGGTWSDAASSIKQISDGGYIVCGSSKSNDGDVSGNHGSSDFWIIKLGNCSAYFSLYPDIQPLHYIAENLASGTSPLTYTWDWGDGTFDNVSYPSHTYDISGNYTICLSITDANSCTDTYCNDYSFKTESPIAYINVIDPLTVGIAESEKQTEGLIIYPNPASNTLTIETAIANGTYQLQDLSGKIILQGSINAARYTLDISILAKGIYVLSITNGDKQAHKKIVKE